MSLARLDGLPDAEAMEVGLCSEMLASAGYNGCSATLYLKFRQDVVYRYEAVPLAVFAALLTAERPGTIFNRRIRENFHYDIDERPRRPYAGGAHP